MRERVIERYLVRVVQARGGFVRKVVWLGARGAPDRLVWVPGAGAAFWVELKAQGEKPSAHQLREHARMRKAGMRVEVAESFADVDALTT